MLTLALPLTDRFVDHPLCLRLATCWRVALTAFTAEKVFFFVRFFAILEVEDQRNTFP